MPKDRRSASSSRQLAAIMFTDIAGYTSLMGDDEDHALNILKKNRSIQKPIVKKYGGKWLKEMGDGVLTIFHTVTDAVYCAVDIQEACADDKDLNIRIGIHQGEIITEEEDVFGDGVNIASRLQALAPVGGIYVSESVFRNIENKHGIEATFIREEILKNVKHPVNIYEIKVDDTFEPDQPDEKSGIKTGSLIKLRYYILAAAGLIIILMAIFWLKKPSGTTIKERKDLEKSIAVLPFKNLSDDVKNQYFCDGIMEGILNHLCRIEDLRVLSRTSTEKYRDTNFLIPEIASELNVTYLVEASVFKAGNKVRVTAQLINARNDEHIWSEQYDRNINDIFEVMSDISTAVAEEVQVFVAPEVKERIVARPTDNMEAYDNYLRGLEYKYAFLLDFVESDFNSAIQFYEKAIELDSTFALAYAHMGILRTFHSATADFYKSDFMDTVLYYANKALTFDPDLSEGYELLAWNALWRSNHEKTLEYTQKAIELNPNNFSAYSTLGIHYMNTNEYIKCISTLRKAKSLITDFTKEWVLLWNFGGAYDEVCYYSKAEEQYLELARIHPMQGYRALANLGESQGDFEKMKFYIDKLCALDSGQDCYRELSDWYLHTKNYASALKYDELNRSVSFDRFGEDHEIRSKEYAFLLYKTGKIEEAEKIFDEEITSAFERIRSGLGGAI